MKTYRKHWSVYIFPVLNLFLLTFLLYYWLLWDVADSIAGTIGVKSDKWFNYGIFMLYFLVSANYLNDILVKASMKITVSEETVTYKQGFLPWRKRSWYWKGWSLFQSTASIGFSEWIFNKCDVNIIDTEGTTKGFLIHNVSKGKNCASDINSLAERSRRGSN